MPPTTFQFEIEIRPVGGELELELTTQVVEQRNRRDANTGKPGHSGQRRKNRIKEAKEARRKSAAGEAEILGPHMPIILIDHATVRDILIWRCDAEFVVDMCI